MYFQIKKGQYLVFAPEEYFYLLTRDAGNEGAYDRIITAMAQRAKPCTEHETVVHLMH